MRIRLYRPILAACLCLCIIATTKAQSDQSTFDKITDFPSRFIDKVNKKASSLESDLQRQTIKYLQHLQKQEEKLKRKLSKVDSTSAARLFNAGSQYTALINKVKGSASTAGGAAPRQDYIPGLDSIKGSLSFLEQNSNLISADKELQDKLRSSLSEIKDLQAKLSNADEVNDFIRQRKEQIKASLSRYTNLPSSITNSYNDYTKQLYYYTQQLREYREILNDPDKLTQKALSLLNKLPAFQQFMKQNSQLASLFGSSTNYGGGPAIAGLQTRDQVLQMIQTQLSAAGPNAQAILQQNLQNAQSQLSQLKDKVNKFGEGGGDIDMPDFKPNKQKTKSFWKRLEYGTNLQTAHSSFFYPTTSDMGLSVGYKINNNSTIGIGASYKMGWGKDIQHIALTSEGASIRSFLDMKLKGSFYATGGLEYNYQVPADPPQLTAGLSSLTTWQQSGLIGVSKIINVKTKLFKKTKVQLLWDFLSYEQVPRAQPLKFRVGYNF